MKKDPTTYIKHILECISLIEEYTEDKTIDDFLESTQLQDAVSSLCSYTSSSPSSNLSISSLTRAGREWKSCFSEKR